MDKLPDSKELKTLKDYRDRLIIFIVGSTASGKTKLSLELGKYIKNAEIINADSMQLYKKADIMTAKATLEEQALVKHHMLDILELDQGDFNRNMYFERVSPLLLQLFEENKVPIIVGGTNYYMETILFSDYEILSNNPQADLADDLQDDNKKFEEVKKQPIDEEIKEGNQEFKGIPEKWMELDRAEKYSLLKSIDPLIAAKLHPNDAHRVENYIKMYIDEDILPSKKVLEANQKRKLRFTNPLIFWPKWQNKEDLNKKIAERIDEMVNLEGIREIVEIFQFFEKQGTQNSLQGAFQSIGYKEFEPFINHLKEEKNAGLSQLCEYVKGLSKPEELSPKALEILESCKAKLVVKTRHYAKRQITWIKNRFATNELINPRLFKLEFDTADNFKQKQIPFAIQVYEDWKQRKFKILDEEAVAKLFEDEKNWSVFYCESCKVECKGEKAHKEHLQSKKHKKTLEKERKMKRNAEFIMKKQLENNGKPTEMSAKEDK